MKHNIKLIISIIAISCIGTYTHIYTAATPEAATPENDSEQLLREQLLNDIDSQWPTIMKNVKQYAPDTAPAAIILLPENLQKLRTQIKKRELNSTTGRDRFNKIIHNLKTSLIKKNLSYIEESKPSASQPIQLVGYLAVGAGIFDDKGGGYKKFNQLLPNYIISLANKDQAPLEVIHREITLQGTTVQDFHMSIDQNIAEGAYTGRNPVTDIQPVVSDADLTFESQGNTFTQTFRLVDNPNKENIWTVINNSDAAPHSYDIEQALLFGNPEENRLIIGTVCVYADLFTQLVFLLPMIGNILQGTTPEQQALFMHRFLSMPVAYKIQDETGFNVALLEQIRSIHNFIINIPLYEDTNQQIDELIDALQTIPNTAQAKASFIIQPVDAITNNLELKSVFERYYEQIRGTKDGMAEKLKLIRSRITKKI